MFEEKRNDAIEAQVTCVVNQVPDYGTASSFIGVHGLCVYFKHLGVVEVDKVINFLKRCVRDDNELEKTEIDREVNGVREN